MSTDIHEVLRKIEELQQMVKELDAPEHRYDDPDFGVIPSPLKPGTYQFRSR